MSNPVIPGKNQDSSKRFRRIFNTDENKDADNVDLGENKYSEAKTSDLNKEENLDSTNPDTPTKSSEQLPESPSIHPESQAVDVNGAGPSTERAPEVSQDITTRVSINSPVSAEKTQQGILAIDEYGMPLPGRINRSSRQTGTTNPIPTQNQQSQPIKSQPGPGLRPKIQVKSTRSEGVKAQKKAKKPEILHYR